MKQTIRLRESELRRMISESVKKTINEVGETPKYQYLMGRAAARNRNRGYSQWHNGEGDNGLGYAERGKKLGQYATSKLEDEVKPIYELLDELYSYINYYCDDQMESDYYEQVMDLVDDFYRQIKEKIDELASKPYHQGYRDQRTV